MLLCYSLAQANAPVLLPSNVIVLGRRNQTYGCLYHSAHVGLLLYPKPHPKGDS